MFADGRAFGEHGRSCFRRGGWLRFWAASLAIFVAVASPLDTFSESLLFMHMAQHFVLMSIAPPLIVLGAPVVPMLRGLARR
jgi:putative membrane protein